MAQDDVKILCNIERLAIELDQLREPGFAPYVRYACVLGLSVQVTWDQAASNQRVASVVREEFQEPEWPPRTFEIVVDLTHSCI